MNLKEILKEYDQKRTAATLSQQAKKDALYSEYPGFEDIDSKINKLALQTSMAVLNSSPISIEELQNSIAVLKKEKQTLLASLGKPKNYLEISYDCPLCKDTGYINNSLCSCIKQKAIDEAYSRSQIGNIQSINFGDFDVNLYNSNPDPSRYNSDISPKENIEIVKNAAISFCDNFSDHSQKNLMFSGGTGLR